MQGFSPVTKIYHHQVFRLPTRHDGAAADAALGTCLGNDDSDEDIT